MLILLVTRISAADFDELLLLGIFRDAVGCPDEIAAILLFRLIFCAQGVMVPLLRHPKHGELKLRYAVYCFWRLMGGHEIVKPVVFPLVVRNGDYYLTVFVLFL